jgi:hypothetical protein
MGIARAVVAGRATEGYRPPGPAGNALPEPLPVFIGARGEAFNRYASAEADGAFLGPIPFADLGAVVGWTRSVRPELQADAWLAACCFTPAGHPGRCGPAGHPWRGDGVHRRLLSCGIM